MSVHTDRRRHHAVTFPQLARHVAPPSAGLTPATVLTGATAGLALVSSLLGLLINGIYTGALSTAEMLRGYDLVTAVVVVPALAVTTRKAHHGSTRAQLGSTSLVAYLVYTYDYYLFGTDFNDLFLLHAAVLGTAVVALVLNLTSINVAEFAEMVRTGEQVRGAAVVLGVLATALGGMWVYVALDNALTGAIPAGSQLVETDTIVHLGMALDLALLVPLYGAAAVLLWRRAPWGHVLGSISLIAGVLHQVSYIVAMPFQVAADVPGAVAFDPVEPVIVLLYLLGTALLVRRPQTEATRMEEQTR